MRRLRSGDLIDLSPPADPGLGVWPGDTPLTRESLARLRDGDTVELSTLRATVHLGTHTDAWSHIVDGAPAIDEMPLDSYLGPCLVIHVDVDRNDLITPEHLAPAVESVGVDVTDAPRLLVATGTFPDPNEFNTDFASFHADAATWAADRGAVLLGIDTPSIDPFDSKELPTHQVCVERQLGMLEGVMLHEVPAGRYELSALPLPLVGFDASPVRAVLRVP